MGKDSSRKFLLEFGWEKVPNWECLFVNRKQGLSLEVCVDDIKMVGRKQILSPMWKKLVKLVDVGEPTSFLDHVFLGCTQRETIIEEYRVFESRISIRAAEKLPGWRETSRKNCRGVIRYGRSREKVR